MSTKKKAKSKKASVPKAAAKKSTPNLDLAPSYDDFQDRQSIDDNYLSDDYFPTKTPSKSNFVVQKRTRVANSNDGYGNLTDSRLIAETRNTRFTTFKGDLGNSKPPAPPPPPLLKRLQGELTEVNDVDDQAVEFDGYDELENYTEQASKLVRPSSGALKKGRLQLRNPNATRRKRNLIPIKVSREDLYFSLDNFKDTRFYPVNSAWRAIADHMQSGDITSLDFQGIDQLTDALFYYLIANKIDLTYLSYINFDGCIHISDSTITCLLKLCGGRNLKEISLKCCRNVTSVGLKNIIEKCPNLETVHADGTSVSVIPKQLVSSNVIVKLNGCPVVHSRTAQQSFSDAQSGNERKKVQHSKVPHYNVVIWNDDKVPCSLGSFLTKKEFAKPVPGMTHFSSTKWLDTHFNETIGVNIFEIFGEDHSISVDMVLSKGSLVVIPYSYCHDLDNEVNMLIRKVASVVSKTPMVNIVFVEVVDGDVEGLPPSPQILPQITAKFKDLKDSIASDINDINQKGKYASGLDFKGQQQAALLYSMHEMMDIIITRSSASRLPCNSKAGTISDEADTDRMFGIIRGAITKIDQQVLTTFSEVDQDFHQHLIQPLLTSKEIAPFTDIVKTLPTKTQNEYYYSSLLKAFEILDMKGLCVFNANFETKLCFTDFSKMTKILQSLLNPKFRTVQLGEGLRIPFISDSIPCWTKEDLTNSLKGLGIKDPANFVRYLEEIGHIIALRCDRFKEDQGSLAYVPYPCIPSMPDEEVLNTLWPDPPPDPKLNIQKERVYNFKHGMPASFMASLLQKSSQTAQFQLLWKNGAIIQHGCVDCLIEAREGGLTGQVYLYIGVRMKTKIVITPNNYPGYGDAKNILWHTLILYSNMIEVTMKQMNTYAQILCICPHCEVEKSRLFKASQGFTNSFPMPLVLGVKRDNSKLSCTGPCGKKDIPTQDVIGPDPTDSLVPAHEVRKVQRVVVKDLLEKYSKCFLCLNCADRGLDCPQNGLNGRSQRNCACDTKLVVCPFCGVCERCKQNMISIERQLYPVLSSYSTMDYLAKQSRHDPSHSPGTQAAPSPNKGNIVVVRIGNVLKMEPDDVSMSPGQFDILEICLLEPRSSQFSIAFFKDKTQEDALLTYKSRRGEMLINTNGKSDTKKSPNWSADKGDTIQIKIEHDSEKIGNLKSSVVLLLNGEVMRREKGLPVKLYPTLMVYNDNGNSVWGVSEPTEFFLNAPSFRYCKASSQELNVPPSPSDVCNNNDRQLIGFSAKEICDFACIEVVKNALDKYSDKQLIPTVILPKDVTVEMSKYPHWTLVDTHNVKQYLIPICLSVGEELTARVARLQALNQTYLSEHDYSNIHIQSSSGKPVDQYVSSDLTVLQAYTLFRLVFEPKLNIREIDGVVNIKSKAGENPMTLAEISHWVQKALNQIMWQINLPPPDSEEDQSKLKYYETLLSGFGDISPMCDAHKLCTDSEYGPELLQTIKTFDAQYITFLSIGLEDQERIKMKNEFSLPDDMFKFVPNLLRLEILNAPLETLPRGIGNCSRLSEVVLDHNLLTDLPDDFDSCKGGLKWLDISNNRMKTIPPVVLKCTNLQTLMADHLFISELPQNMGDLKYLKTLSLSGNCLRSLPPSIRQLKRLKYLNLSGVEWFGRANYAKDEMFGQDKFANFLNKQNMVDCTDPQDISELFGEFDQDRNAVIDLEERVAGNVRLYSQYPRLGLNGSRLLDIQDNDAKQNNFHLPEEIFSLGSLETLDISYQGITNIKNDISKLKKLKHLNLTSCLFLKELPGRLGELSLDSMSLTDCPSLRTPPREIQRRGYATVLNYLKHLETGSTSCKRTKLMLVGLGGAGKTSLVGALLSGTGKANLRPGEQITDGIDIHEWKVSDKKSDSPITYSVWDFAGQTVYYNTHQFFLSNRAVYLLLWNIRLGHEHAGLDFWLNSISVHAPKAPIFVVGTHLDQVSKSDLPMEEMKQKYPQIVGFHFVSTHTSQGVMQLQNNLIETTLQQRYMGESIPQVWLELEASLIKERSSAHVVPFTTVEDIAADVGILSDSQNRAIQFLHELGSIIHFDNEFLRDRVVVDPQWIVDVMACVVSVKDSPIKRQDGRFLHSDMSKVWKDYDAALHPWLLRLTEEYDLTFPLPDKDVNLVPCLLPEKQPKLDWPELDKNSSLTETKMVYKFVYLPAGLFNRGQVRLYQYSDSSLIWKKGSFLRKKGHIALVTQTSHTEMVVKVQGAQPENLVFMVHEVFQGLISESFHGVQYEYFGPCPDCAKNSIKDPFMFSSATLRRAKVMKASFLQCSTYFHNISISSLSTNMPPDSSFDYDQQLISTVQTLTNLKRDMGADIFLSYCEKDLKSNDTVNPSSVKNDLEKVGYNCYFPQCPSDPDSLEKLAIVARDSNMFVVFVSDAYAEDPTCCSLFKFIRHSLNKPWVMVVIGEGQNWKKSSIGVFIADELFVNMAQKSRYHDKIEELKKKVLQRASGEKVDKVYPPCFLSYCWSNSLQAIKKGSRKKEGALGWGDPRDLKEFLEENGIKCWIDIENIGQRGLFEDIAEGLRNAKVVVACISDEYASSDNCMMEFRFATGNLNLPTILSIVGTRNNWKRTEIGMLSQKNLLPEINFQEEAPGAKEKLLKMVKSHLSAEDKDIDPEKKDKGLDMKKGKDSDNEEKRNTSYNELFELAQRHFLRQVNTFAEESGEIYPRLLVLDFLDMHKEESDMDEKSEDGGSDQNKTTRPTTAGGRPGLVKRPTSGLKAHRSAGPKSFENRKFGVKVLCEHEEGWHSYSEPVEVPTEFVDDKLEFYAPYLARITAILRHSNNLYLQCATGLEGGQYFKWLEEQPDVTSSDFGDVYKQFRKDIIQFDSKNIRGELARCHLPNGKTVWLCPVHQKLPRITILNEDSNTVIQGADSEHDEALLEALSNPTEKGYREIIEKQTKDWPQLPQYSALQGYKFDDDVIEEADVNNDYEADLGWSSDEEETSNKPGPSRPIQKEQSTKEDLLTFDFGSAAGEVEQVPFALTKADRQLSMASVISDMETLSATDEEDDDFFNNQNVETHRKLPSPEQPPPSAQKSAPSPAKNQGKEEPQKRKPQSKTCILL